MYTMLVSQFDNQYGKKLPGVNIHVHVKFQFSIGHLLVLLMISRRCTIWPDMSGIKQGKNEIFAMATGQLKFTDFQNVYR